MIKKQISFTDRMAEMVEEIQAAKGYVSFSAVIHSSIAEMHNKVFPSYLRPLAKDEDISSRIRRKASEKEAKKSIVKDELYAIAEALDGKVVSDGVKETCIYYTYAGKKRYEQQVPLHMLTEDLVKTQYQPSREAVERLQKEGKTDYKVGKK